ncbi:hypothetical protein T439DRAFT_375939 [Meredithblackwellia eburnea MCA 4105]
MAQASTSYPTTFAGLQDILFPNCEDFINAARRIAAAESITLTITHKSRNSPGKPQTQYRGCLVLSCIQWTSGCTFELKAWGPIDGGWRMRPLQHPGLKRHTVTSWCMCNHPKQPLRTITPPQISTWSELVSIPFPMADDFISAAHRVASLQNVRLSLLTLMISDGKPKPNGKDTMYTPRGFITLECAEADNGCPFAIKAREEGDVWYMRPWRERGKTEVKGAVSIINCKHGADVAAAFRAKQVAKEKKSKEPKPKGEGKQTADPDELHVVDPNIPSGIDTAGLDPLLTHSTNFDSPSATLSQAQILGQIEQLGVGTSAFSPSHSTDPSHHFDENGFHHTDPFGHHHHHHHDTSVFGPSTSADTLDPFHSNLTFQSEPTPPPAPGPTTTSLKRLNGSSASPDTGSAGGVESGSAPNSSSSSYPETQRAAKRPRGKKDLASTAANGNPASTTTHTIPGSSSTLPTGSSAPLKTTWITFLTALDPQGRLSALNAVLADGGIDPGAVVVWPEEDVREFVDTVGTAVPHGVRIHFRVLLTTEGKRVWGELQKKLGDFSAPSS